MYIMTWCRLEQLPVRSVFAKKLKKSNEPETFVRIVKLLGYLQNPIKNCWSNSEFPSKNCSKKQFFRVKT